MIKRALPFLMLAAAGCGTAKTAPQAPPAPPVIVAKSEVRTVPFELRGIGNVEATATVDVRSRVAGPILKVHVTDGADVKKGQTLFSIDPEPYRVALAGSQAQLGRDQALLQKARSDVTRYGKLVEKEYVTREQYESAEAQAASLAETIKSDQAAVDGNRLALSYCTIAAPIAGRIGVVSRRAGNLVKADDDPPLVTILQMRPVYVTFSVPERHLAEIRAQSAKGPLTVLARSRGAGGTGHPGTLAFIDNAVDAATGTIRLRGTFPNADAGLWPGQFVEVAITVREQEGAVVVPSPAIQVGQQGSFVYVVGDDKKAEVRPVTVDRTLGSETIVSSGLKGGETVIVDGQLRVIPGAVVSPQAAP